MQMQSCCSPFSSFCSVLLKSLDVVLLLDVKLKRVVQYFSWLLCNACKKQMQAMFSDRRSIVVSFIFVLLFLPSTCSVSNMYSFESRETWLLWFSLSSPSLSLPNIYSRVLFRHACRFPSWFQSSQSCLASPLHARVCFHFECIS